MRCDKDEHVISILHIAWLNIFCEGAAFVSGDM